MRFWLLIALILPAAYCFAESEGELENKLGLLESQMTQAQGRLRTAERSVTANTEALSKAKSPIDQKSLRSSIALAQSNIARERTQIASFKREIETINARLDTLRKPNPGPAAELKPQHIAPAPNPVDGVSPARAPKLIPVVLKDGRKLECVRFMEVEEEYVLQMPDKKLQNIRKSDVVSIDGN